MQKVFKNNKDFVHTLLFFHSSNPRKSEGPIYQNITNFAPFAVAENVQKKKKEKENSHTRAFSGLSLSCWLGPTSTVYLSLASSNPTIFPHLPLCSAAFCRPVMITKV